MNYQITCTCGHKFLVPSDKVNDDLTCPACGQLLHPVIRPDPSPPESPFPPPTPSPAPPPSTPSPRPTTAESPPPDPVSPGTPDPVIEQTKRCPYCGEVILAIARKCKHCGEFLDRPAHVPASQSGSATPTGPADAKDTPPAFALCVSQWDNLWRFAALLGVVILIAIIMLLIPAFRSYAAVAIFGALALAFFVGYYFYLTAQSTKCVIRPFRIDTETGILSKNTNSLELFRVTDIKLEQNLLERILRIGTIRMVTADSSNPEMVLYRIPRAHEVLKFLQEQVPIAARMRGAVYMEK